MEWNLNNSLHMRGRLIIVSEQTQIAPAALLI